MRTLTNALLALVSIGLTLFFIEGALRLTPFAGLLSVGAPPNGYFSSSEAGYDITPNFATTTHTFSDASYSVWSNSLGCFDEPYTGEQADILLVGDSMAWGFAPFEDKWGTRLQTHVNRRVLTCGVAGYGTKQQYIKTKKLLEIVPRPRMLLVSYFLNDRGDDAAYPNSLVYEGRLVENPHLASETDTEITAALKRTVELSGEYCLTYEPTHPTLQRLKCFLRRHSVLYILAQEGIKRTVPATLLKGMGIVNMAPPEAPAPPETLSGHFQNLRALRDVAAQKEIPLLFVFVPTKTSVTNATSSGYETIQSFMSDERIPYLDVFTVFKSVSEHGVPLYWRFDEHLNKAGNHLLGYLVARKILQDAGTTTAHQISVLEQTFTSEFPQLAL